MKHGAVEPSVPPTTTPHLGENSSQHFLEPHLCPTPESAHCILSIPGGGSYDFLDEEIEPLSRCLTQGNSAASGEVRTELSSLVKSLCPSRIPYHTARQQGLELRTTGIQGTKNQDCHATKRFELLLSQRV